MKINIFDKNPNLKFEWNKERNKNINPENVSFGSTKKYWWVCKINKEHEWEASAASRTRTTRPTGCPYCSNRKINLENSLYTLNSFLASEWHESKNYPLSPKKISPSSGKKVWWSCSICSHDWEATVDNRSKNKGCPQCKKHLKTSFPEQVIFFYLKKIFPQAKNRFVLNFNKKSAEVDIYIPDLNLSIEYDGYYYHKDKKDKDQKKNDFLNNLEISLIRIREFGKDDFLPKLKYSNAFEIQRDFRYLYTLKQSIIDLGSTILENFSVDLNTATMLKNLKNINIEEDKLKILHLTKSILKEKSIANTHPEIAKEWHSYLNEKLLPEHVTHGMTVSVFWQCKKNSEHYWKAPINSRTKNAGDCHLCSNSSIRKALSPTNNLKFQNPFLASQWNYKKNLNLTPDKVTPKSNKKVWWICNVDTNHEWEETIANRNKGKNCNCPYCSGRKPTKENCFFINFPELVEEWNSEKNGKLLPLKYKSNSKKIFSWICLKNQLHSNWEASIEERVNGKKKCPDCF